MVGLLVWLLVRYTCRRMLLLWELERVDVRVLRIKDVVWPWCMLWRGSIAWWHTRRWRNHIRASERSGWS